MRPMRPGFSNKLRDWMPVCRALAFLFAALCLFLPFVPRAALAPLAFPMLTKPWTIVTSWFLYSGPMAYLLCILGLWMFGNDVESRLGPRNFLLLLIGAALFGDIVVCLTSGHPGYVAGPIGASCAGAAMMMAYYGLYPQATILVFFVFPLTCQQLAHIVLGLSALNVLWFPGAPSLAILLVEAAVYFYFDRRLKANPLSSMKDQAEEAYRRWKLKQKAAHLTVLKGGKDDAWKRDEEDPKPPVVN